MPVFGGINREKVEDIVANLIKAGANTTVTYNDAANTLTIGSNANSGEANTASNLGVTTYGLFKAKTAVDLGFKSLTAGSNKIALTANTNDVAIDVAEANLTLSNMGGTLGLTHGGTGFTGYTAGDLIIASATNTLSKLGAGSNGQYLKVVTGVPAWATISATEVLPSYATNGSKYLQLSSDATTLQWATISGSGEANTASNLGVTTYGLFKSKVSLDLQFKSLTAGSTKISLTANANDVAIDVVEGNLTLSNMTGTLGVAHGGTGATTLTGIVIGNGTSAFTVVTAPSGALVGTNESQVLSNKTLGANTLIGLASTAAGDIWYSADVSGTLTRLAIGATHKVLTVAAGIPSWADAQGIGETNTASNLGAGQGVFKSKVSVDLQFRSITATSNKILLGNNTNDIGIDVTESNLTISNMGGTLAVGHGGSGAVTLTGILIGNGTSAFTAVTAPSGSVVGTSDTQTLTNKTAGTGTKVLLGSDATGDIYYNGGAGVLTRLAAAADGYILMMASGVPVWSADANGETNTASNLGVTTYGLFKSKVGVDLQFRSLTATSSKISLANNTNDVGIDVNEGNLTISNMAGTLAVGHGGSGAVTLTGVLIGNGTSAFTAVTAPSGAIVGISDSQSLTNKTLGTGTVIALGSDATGDIYYDGGSGVLTRLAIGSTNQVLTVTAGIPSWAAAQGVGEANTASNVGVTTYGLFKAKVSLDLQFKSLTAGSNKIALTANTNDVAIDVVEANLTISNMAGTLGVAHGGTGQTTANAGFNALSPMSALGDLIYGGSAGIGTTLAGNTTSTKKFLTQTGTGSVSAAPSWAALTSSDVGLGSVENTALSTWTGSSNITTLGTIVAGVWSGTVVAANNGGTGFTTYTTGDLVYASATNTLSKLAVGTETYVLTVVSGAPAWAAAGGGGGISAAQSIALNLALW
jgi:hypothetical protein